MYPVPLGKWLSEGEFASGRVEEQTQKSRTGKNLSGFFTNYLNTIVHNLKTSVYFYILI